MERNSIKTTSGMLARYAIATPWSVPSVVFFAVSQFFRHESLSLSPRILSAAFLFHNFFKLFLLNC